MAYSSRMRFPNRYRLNTFGIRRVIVHLRGGIGNQLFQVSAGCYLSENLNLPFFLDKSAVATHSEVNPADISAFQIFHEISYTQNFIRRNFGRLIIKIGKSFLKMDAVTLKMNALGEHDYIFRTFSSLHLSGYFADFVYADKIGFANRNLNLLEVSPWLSEMLMEIKARPTIAVHVRRGDFLSNPEHYGILNVDYYEKALKLIPKALDTMRIWIFSDDLILAESDLASIEIPNFQYINPSASSSAIESLMLMSMADGLVVANSTFSLWAAYLNQGATCIIYPLEDKHGRGAVPKFPEKWIGIDGAWE